MRSERKSRITWPRSTESRSIVRRRQRARPRRLLRILEDEVVVGVERNDLRLVPMKRQGRVLYIPSRDLDVAFVVQTAQNRRRVVLPFERDVGDVVVVKVDRLLDRRIDDDPAPTDVLRVVEPVERNLPALFELRRREVQRLILLRDLRDVRQADEI